MLLVQTSCNLACDYCYESTSGFLSSGTRMSFDTARRIIDHFVERSARRKAIRVTFFGGEPLLNFSVMRRCTEYCNHLVEKSGQSIGYSVTTNGTLLNGEIIAFLVENEFAVMLSIDGEPDKADIHRRDRQGRGATRRALAKAKLLVRAQREAGVRETIIRATLTKENRSMVSTYDYLHQQGFTRIMVGPSSPRPFRSPNDWDVDGEAADDLMRESDEMLQAYAFAGDDEDVPRAASDLASTVRDIRTDLIGAGQPRVLVGCGAGNNMLAYSADGRIFPCHRFVSDDAFVIGDMNAGGLDRARLERFYSEVIETRIEVCGKCWARLVCKGRCPWGIAHPNGTIQSPGWEHCDCHRKSFEKKLWLLKRGHIDRYREHAPQNC